MNIALIVVLAGILIFLAHAFAQIFSRTKIPDVLWLIIIGLCFGPLFGIVTPAHFGAVGPVFVTVTLVVILFESGIGLSLDSLVKAWRGTLALSTLGFIATMIVVGLATFLLTDLGLVSAFMLGAIVGGTSSAVVIPLLRQLKMQSQSSTILLLESALTDVLCIVVALAFLEALKLGGVNVGFTIGRLISSFVLAALWGIVGAFLWSILLKKVRTLQNAIFTTPAFVFVIFGVAELLGYSGYIAALAFGIAIGNIELFSLPLKKVKLLSLPLKKGYIPLEPVAFSETEKMFFSEIVFLLKTFFFVYIGISMQLTNPWWISVGLILTVLIFILRIPIVGFSVSKSTAIEDASLMAVIVPKGLAAAVLASLPLQQGIVGGELIQNVAFAVILFSIVLTSTLVFLLDKTALSKFYRRMFSRFGTPVRPLVESREPADGDSKNVGG